MFHRLIMASVIKPWWYYPFVKLFNNHNSTYMFKKTPSNVTQMRIFRMDAGFKHDGELFVKAVNLGNVAKYRLDTLLREHLRSVLRLV